MEDIAPGLLLRIRASFRQTMEEDSATQALLKKIEDGAATYRDAEAYALRIGEALSQALAKNLGADVLPDGRMYYNIADRVLRPMLEEDHQVISEATKLVQESLNRQAGIGLKAKTVAENQDRIQGIVDKVSGSESFDDVAWVMDEPVKNFSMNVVDEILRENVEFQGKAGLQPKVIRRAERKCCKWCSDLAGEYEYPDVPKDVYRRHENCRCTVEYDPADGKGKIQNVHSKKWTEPGERDIIEERKRFNMGNLGVFRPKEQSTTIQSYVKIDREKAVADAKAGRKHGHAGVYKDAIGKSKKQLQKSIVSRTEQVERHADIIKHPESYIPDWGQKAPEYRQGLIRKWEKDMRRNAEQAEIELAVFEERFGI